MDELEYWSQVEDDLRSIYHVARVEKVGGEDDYLAGQRDRSTTRYGLFLKASVVGAIEEERAEDADGFSDTLDGLRDRLELDMGLAPGDYDTGVLYVSATYDRRPGGSF